MVQIFGKLSEQIFKVFVWFQVIRLGCFCNAVDDSGTLGTTDGVYDFSVLLANAEATNRPLTGIVVDRNLAIIKKYAQVLLLIQCITKGIMQLA